MQRYFYCASHHPAFQKHYSNSFKNFAVTFLELLHDNFSHPFQYYCLKSFGNVIEIFLVLFKGIKKIIQEIFLQRFAKFTRNLSDKISVKKLEMLPEIFLKWFWKSFSSPKHFEQRFKNLAVRFQELLHDKLSPSFQYYFLKSFEKIF